MNQQRSFYSKIILFGEYSIIRDSKALALPFSLYEGSLCFSKEKGPQINSELKEFARFLIKVQNDMVPDFQLDTSSFEFDVSSGMIFDSTIPQGYGVGSSGALCAAIYDRYKQNQSELSIYQLKNIFSFMESYFHGKSSGIDPLISYLNQSFIISKNDIETVEIPRFESGESAIFLLNTGRPRRTEPLVNLFLEKCNVSEFQALCDHVLTPITNQCIQTFLNGDHTSLFEFFRELSDFQFRHFGPMIPKLFKDLWQDGIKNQSYYLKLCGAGGGGFILGMTKDFKKTKEELSSHQIRSLFRF